jgi:uncharacterized protein YggE
MRLILSLVVLAFANLYPTTILAEETSQPGTISIQGEGEVYAEPDLAYVSSGVVSEAGNAREALSANSANMAALIELLKSTGVADRDIQTSNFNVQPQYDYNKSGGNRHKIVGYLVSNNVSVRIRDLDNLGTVLDQMVSVGANSIDQVSFAKNDTKALNDQARNHAMQDAMRMESMAMASEPAPIQAGELTYKISVSVQWELIQ